MPLHTFESPQQRSYRRGGSKYRHTSRDRTASRAVDGNCFSHRTDRGRGGATIADSRARSRTRSREGGAPWPPSAGTSSRLCPGTRKRTAGKNANFAKETGCGFSRSGATGRWLLSEVPFGGSGGLDSDGCDCSRRPLPADGASSRDIRPPLRPRSNSQTPAFCRGTARAAYPSTPARPGSPCARTLAGSFRAVRVLSGGIAPSSICSGAGIRSCRSVADMAG